MLLLNVLTIDSGHLCLMIIKDSKAMLFTLQKHKGQMHNKKSSNKEGNELWFLVCNTVSD